MRNVSSEAKTLSPVDASMLEPLLGREDYSRNLANVTILFGILVRFTMRNSRSRFRQLQEGHTTRHGSRGFHRGSGTVRLHVVCVVSLCRTDIQDSLLSGERIAAVNWPDWHINDFAFAASCMGFSRQLTSADNPLPHGALWLRPESEKKCSDLSTEWRDLKFRFAK
jgi:hypothetical protein